MRDMAIHFCIAAYKVFSSVMMFLSVIGELYNRAREAGRRDVKESRRGLSSFLVLNP